MATTLDPETMRSFLREHLRVLAGLSDSDRERLLADVSTRALAPGETLVRAGEPAGGLIVVHSGLLEVFLDGPDGVRRRVGWRTRGDVVGEAGWLAGRQATETVVVRRHALVLSLAPDACERYLKSSGTATASLAADWIARISLEQREPRPDPLVAALVWTGEPGAAAPIEASFVEACGRRDGTALVSHPASMGSAGPASWFHESEAGMEMVLYFASRPDCDRAAACVARADVTMVLAPAVPQDEVVDRVRQLLAAARRSDVVLVSRNVDGSATAAWSSVLPGQRLLEIPEGNVDILVPGLDYLYDEHGNPGRLRRFEPFAGLDDQELEIVQEAIDWLPFPAGSILMDVGEPAGDVFLVESGRFRVTHLDDLGEHILIEYGAGEAFGETTALTDLTAFVRVRAVRDSYVGRIRHERYLSLLDEVPSLGRNLSNILARRVRELGPRMTPLTAERPPVNVAVVPLSDRAGVASFGRDLAETLDALGLRSCAVDPARVDGQFGAGISGTRSEGPGSGILEEWLQRLEEDHEIVLYLCDNRDSAWTERALRQADLVLFAADATDDPGLREIERPLYDTESWRRTPHLVLLHPHGATEASGTARWLDSRPGTTHHHVRADHASDRARLIRRTLMRAVGIAFSGASSRGVAHLGVLRGVGACGLPVDLTAGSSSGAAIAALATLGLAHEEMLDRAAAFLDGVGPRLTRLQPPLTSLMSGKAFESYLRETFGDRRLEDQWIPCTLTGVDLNRHRLVRMRTGPIWLAVRASCSLPVFWPPVWIGEDLVVDGGILSNMPIEDILGECARGLAIGSDLNVGSGEDKGTFEDYEHYGATVSGWQQLAGRLTAAGRQRRYPSLGDVVLNAMCIPSFAQQERIQRLDGEPTVRFVRPPLPYEGFFAVDAETSRRYELLAYEVAVRELEGAEALTLP